MPRPLGVVAVMGILLSSTAGVHAQPIPTIWYRSSDGCEGGSAFIARLEQRNVRATLAGPADHIDFVVTLGKVERGASGRLERQTEAGTVAIREIAAETCDEVADALALSLTLSFDPNSERPEPRSHPTPEVATEPVADVRPTSGAPPPAAESAARSEVASTPVMYDSPVASRAKRHPARWSAGGQASMVAGVSPETMPVLGLFVERALGEQALAPGFRLSSHAGRSTSPTDRGDLSVVVVAARLEACLLARATASVHLEPCLGAEGGFLRADMDGPSGTERIAGWAAVVLHGRARWSLGPSLAIEAQAGPLFPLTRHVIAVENPAQRIHRTAAIGVEAGLGVLASWP